MTDVTTETDEQESPEQEVLSALNTVSLLVSALRDELVESVGEQDVSGCENVLGYATVGAIVALGAVDPKQAKEIVDNIEDDNVRFMIITALESMGIVIDNQVELQ